MHPGGLWSELALLIRASKTGPVIDSQLSSWMLTSKSLQGLGCFHPGSFTGFTSTHNHPVGTSPASNPVLSLRSPDSCHSFPKLCLFSSILNHRMMNGRLRGRSLKSHLWWTQKSPGISCQNAGLEWDLIVSIFSQALRWCPRCLFPKPRPRTRLDSIVQYHSHWPKPRQFKIHFLGHTSHMSSAQ